MKLTTLLGLLLFIAPMFAADPPGAITPNACRGKKRGVKKCAGEPCTMELRRRKIDNVATSKL